MAFMCIDNTIFHKITANYFTGSYKISKTKQQLKKTHFPLSSCDFTHFIDPIMIHEIQMYRTIYKPFVLFADSMICSRQRPNSSITILSCTTGGIFSLSASSAWANRQAHVASATSEVKNVYGSLQKSNSTFKSFKINIEAAADNSVKYLWLL